MNVVIKLTSSLAIMLLLLGVGCKDPIEPIAENIEGIYRVYAKVTKRPKIFEPEYAPPWAVERYGVWIDTTENVCCASKTSKIEDCCPDEYVMEDFEIFLHDGVYYIRNKLIYDADSNRLTWDIPLIITQDKLQIDKSAYFKRDAFIGDIDYHPSSFNLMSFQLALGELNGLWIIHDYTCSDFAYSCFNTADNKTYRYGMGEFAELRFEKIE